VLVLLWRWRYEIAFLVGLPAGIFVLLARVGWLWSLIGAAMVAALLAFSPKVRFRLFGHARCVLTAHQVRTGCAQAWIHTRYGKLPIVLMTSPKPFGERVRIWCRAGTCLEDFEAAREIFRAACWASEVHITASTRHAQIVILDVIRRKDLHRPW
jgi:hypothetical protein